MTPGDTNLNARAKKALTVGRVIYLPLFWLGAWQGYVKSNEYEIFGAIGWGVVAVAVGMNLSTIIFPALPKWWCEARGQVPGNWRVIPFTGIIMATFACGMTWLVCGASRPLLWLWVGALAVGTVAALRSARAVLPD